MTLPSVVVYWLALLAVADCEETSILPPIASIDDRNLLTLPNKTTGTRTELCSKKPCIRKCCRGFEIAVMDAPGLNSGYCDSRKKLGVANETHFISAKVNYQKEQIVEVGNVFVPIVDFKMIFDSNRTSLFLGNFYLDTSGSLMIRKPHFWVRWSSFDTEHYCLDYVKMQSGEIVVRPFSWDEFSQDQRNWIVQTVAMLISSAFLVATLAVYSYVPRLRNLHGKVLMAYAASLLGFFLFFSITQWKVPVGNDNKRISLIMAVPTYFSLMATLFWMNIISFDIWNKFRNMFRSKEINPSGELCKFKMYCLYGFGCPLLMSIVFGVLTFVPEDYLSDDIVTPGIPDRGSFIGEGERIPFIYIPMCIIMVVNFCFFVATVLNIYKLKRDARSLQNADFAKTPKKQFYLCFKLFILTGVSWILDFVATTSPGSEIWCVVDIFNFLLGVFIFFIYVGKRRILSMITTRYQERKGTLHPRYSRPQNSSSVTGKETEYLDCTSDGDTTRQPVDFSNKARQSDAALIYTQN